MSNDLVLSNSLVDLAARIKAEHEATATAMKSGIEHAMKAGALLIEAKEQVPHGQWLPWIEANCAMSERTAQLYMRLTRHKDIVDTKSATVADLTIRGAVAEITEPKKPFDVQHLPLAGHIKIGVRETAAGWDEVCIAPHQFHETYYYVTHIWTPRVGNIEVTGVRKPIRADMISTLIEAHLACNLRGIEWRDKPYPAWTCNLLLFADMGDYIESIGIERADFQDLVDIVKGRAPRPDGVQLKKRLRPGKETPRPLFDLIAEIEQEGRRMNALDSAAPSSWVFDFNECPPALDEHGNAGWVQVTALQCHVIVTRLMAVNGH